MSDFITQFGIMIFGCLGVWLVGRREKWRRWGYIMGLFAQPFWFWTSYEHEQWGIFFLSFWYAYSWGQGAYNFWIKEEGGSFKGWYMVMFKLPYTVAYDLSPFSHPYNERERLEQVNGLWRARRFAKQWVYLHPYGQARILEGHHSWKDDEE